MAGWCVNTPCCSIRRCSRRTAWRPRRRRCLPSAAPTQPRVRFPVPRRDRTPGRAARGRRWRRQLRSTARRQPVGHRAPPVGEHRVRTDQLMVGIYRGNSGAFEGDMNRLRAGAVLRIPGGEEIAAVSPSEARGEVRRLAGSWAASSARRPVADACAWCRRAIRRRARMQPPGECRRGRRPAEPRARARRPAHRIEAHARAAQHRTCRPAGEARRLAAAAAQPDSGRRCEQPLPQPEAVTPAAGSHAPEASRDPTPEPAPTPSRTPTPATDTRAAARGRRDRCRGRPSLLDKLIEYWCLLAGALVLLHRSAWYSPSRAASARSPNSTTTWAASPNRAKTAWLSRWIRSPTPAACARRTWARFRTTSSSKNRARIARCRKRRTSRSRRTVRTDETISSETAVNLDQGDPLAEADFHMAYGLYDQAADLVRIAIQREPDRRDLKLKLLEVFFVWGNKEQFLTIGARACRVARRSRGRASGKRSSSWASRLPPKIRCSRTAPVAAAAVGVDLNLDGGGSGRVDFDPFDVSSRLDVTGGGNADPVDLDLGSALRDPDATGEGLALPTRDSERPDHARNDRQDDAGRLRSPDRRTTRAASARRADDSREGRRRDAPQALARIRPPSSRSTTWASSSARSNRRIRRSASSPWAACRADRCQRAHDGRGPRRELTAPAGGGGGAPWRRKRR